MRTSVAERRRARQAQALRAAVVELPIVTRRAMLDALEDDELIIGAYTDRRGRICPMLAAHRRGARTDVGSFPRAWDAFGRARRPRPATRRELEILKALLEEGLASGDDAGDAGIYVGARNGDSPVRDLASGPRRHHRFLPLELRLPRR